MTSCSPKAPEWVRRCRPLLGTYVEVAADSEAAMEAAFAAIASVHLLMSFQDPASELSRINRSPPGRWTACHPWTAEVLGRAMFWAEASGGAFDPAVGGDGAWPGVELRAGEVRRLGAAAIDLSGIAKGYAVDRAAAAMRGAGGRRGLVNAGGDMVAFGGEAHDVDVVDPDTRAPAVRTVLTDRALATSAGRRGGAGRWRSATVAAPRAIDADALTKIVLADTPATLACLALADAEALCLGADGWREVSPAAAA